MKAKIHSILFAFFVVLSITGCENEIDLKADDTTGLLCINGNLTAGADDNVIYVAVTGKELAHSVNNAKVVVSVNGGEVETINGSSTNRGDNYYEGYGIYSVTAKFYPGDYVQVDVYYGEQHAYGGGVVPQPVKDLTVKNAFVPNVYYKRNSWSESYVEDDMITSEISFSDSQQNEKNYFRLGIYQSDSVKMRIDDNGYYLDAYSWNLTQTSTLDEQKQYEQLGSTYGNYKECYFDNDPILSAEVVKSDGDLSFMEAVDNVYKIFNDNFFDGKQATLNVMSLARFNLEYFKPEKFYINITYPYEKLTDAQIDFFAPRYTHRTYVSIYSITADEYYYLKVLNARGPDSYFEWDDGMSLTGDVKLPSNVKGGTGNIFVSSCAKITGCLYEDYVPEYMDFGYYIYGDDNYGDYGEKYYGE